MIGQGRVAVLRLPLQEWEALAPQQQLLSLVQQMIGFMASGAYGEMDGMQVVAIDTTNVLAKPKVLLQVGAEPEPTSGLIAVN